MEFFDCHLHVEKGLNDYTPACSNGNVIFNTLESFHKHSASYGSFYQTLIFDNSEKASFYNQLYSEKKIHAIKIHSRLQKIAANDYPDLIDSMNKLDAAIPVIYDAFYYGNDLEYQPSLEGLLKIIRSYPERKIIVAHSGGYEVLKYFFHLRENPNVGFDLSFSLQYLNDTSCRPDLVKLLKYTSASRIFFGSDYPFCSPELQLNIFLKMADEAGLDEFKIKTILNTGWIDFITNKHKG